MQTFRILAESVEMWPIDYGILQRVPINNPITSAIIHGVTDTLISSSRPSDQPLQASHSGVFPFLFFTSTAAPLNTQIYTGAVRTTSPSTKRHTNRQLITISPRQSVVTHALKHSTKHHQNSLNPLTPTVAIWVQSILCQTGLSRHL